MGNCWSSSPTVAAPPVEPDAPSGALKLSSFKPIGSSTQEKGAPGGFAEEDGEPGTMSSRTPWLVKALESDCERVQSANACLGASCTSWSEPEARFDTLSK